MANMKKKSDGSNTKPFNVKLMTPRELVGGKEPKKPAPSKPTVSRAPSKGTKTPMPKTGPSGKKVLMPKVAGAKPSVKTPKPKVTKKPEKMTKQDAAMKKILEARYGKIYG